MSIAPRRLGMFGGAFDPPHRAHVALAQAAVAQFALDELRVFPTGQAWHRAHELTLAEHRLAMARIAFAGLPHVVVDDHELRRPGPTYTVDTLRELRAGDPAAQLFLVMGEDQASVLTRWHEWRSIVEMATLLIASRTGPEGDAPPFGAALPAGARFFRLQLPSMPESASAVRERLAGGEGIAHLVPEGVARYIDHNHLYQTA